MESSVTNDNNLIIALADDYLNVYLTRPEEDSLDVIKANGYVTEGTEGSWTNLKFSTILDNYVRNRVHPDDKEMIMSECCAQNIIKVLSDQKVFQVRYRILENGQTHHCGLKYVKISAPGEPLRAVVAFRNVDHAVFYEQKKLEELRDVKNIMAASQMGTWHITIVEGCPPTMTADDKMKELLGIPSGAKLSDEELYQNWYSRIDPKAVESVNKSVREMMHGHRSENTYRWHHPILGERFVRCGGTAIPIPGGHILSGYHYDVTDQFKREIRSKFIIESLAHSYEYIYYVRVYNGTYITYSDNVNKDASQRQLPRTGDVHKAIEHVIENSVLPTFRKDMAALADLSTLDERLKNRKVLISQFKDVKGVWHEWSYIVAERNDDGTIKHLIWAIRQIDDEKQAEIRQQQLLEDNIAANKAKTMFLQNMSHEIRTPLNAMFGFAQLLGLPDGSWTEEEKKQYNAYIFNSYNMLDMLIGDIIDIADSEHGNYRINISGVPVNEICRNAMMSIEYRVPFGVNLYYTSDVSDDHIVESDGRRIQQVLINYLTNACKHTQQGEIHVHCSTSENPGKLTFSVTDTGEGVPADKADIIFNRFTKLNNFIQGSGLGLNICRMVASKLGGEVYLDKNYTNGARFVFVIDDKC
ncbi:MAG: HAMP domain-containing histidine kinase [Bacteroidales bacterium]|nr:HAMP domain-containing histidine kinase [Bacteroidales bacterium]